MVNPPWRALLSRSVLAREHRVRARALELARAAELPREVRDAVRLLRELLLARLDLLAEPVVDLQTLDELVRPVPFAAARHRKHDPLRDPVRVPVRADRGGEPVALRRRRHEGFDRVRDGHRGGRRGGPAPLFNQRAAARLNRRRELLLEPRVVADHLHRLLAVDLRVHEIRHLRRGVVPPDRDVRDGVVEHARLERQLALGAVLVETRQRVEVLPV
mmetsp:Transcript_2890/g.9434  ORF Transcript_2890/g.9434 Transcript_2890/m.9434 type:complete len:217 (-) Transcript_2890:754-1404(-)